jgi:hypothetical protein
MVMTSAEVLVLAMVAVHHGWQRGWNRCSRVLPCSEEGEDLEPLYCFLGPRIDPWRPTSLVTEVDSE